LNNLPLGSAPARLDTPYQAILLTNGHVCIGKLAGLRAHFLVLTDVYYIQSRVKEQTKQVTNVIVRREKEQHAPDR
jgi:hypothetical protein